MFSFRCPWNISSSFYSVVPANCYAWKHSLRFNFLMQLLLLKFCCHFHLFISTLGRLMRSPQLSIWANSFSVRLSSAHLCQVFLFHSTGIDDYSFSSRYSEINFSFHSLNRLHKETNKSIIKLTFYHFLNKTLKTIFQKLKFALLDFGQKMASLEICLQKQSAN